MKTVLFILPALTTGGAEKVMITFMNNLDNERFHAHFLAISDKGDMGQFIDDRVTRRISKINWLPLSLPVLFLEVLRTKPDIVITTMAPMNFVTLLLKPFFPKTKFIVREAIMPSFILDGRPKTQKFLIKKLYTILYPQADLVISPSKRILDYFKNDMQLCLSKEYCLPNPVSISKTCSSSPLPGKEKPKDSLLFICVGRLHYQKGYDRLISALSTFQSPYDWHLKIVGEGEERQRLEQLIKSHNLENRVALEGLKENPYPYYVSADCLLLPSRSEGLPNVVLEALACGTPVISTKEAGGIIEIAEEAERGAVTLTDNVSDFLPIMNRYAPGKEKNTRSSLLPKIYKKETVIAKFHSVLESLSN